MYYFIVNPASRSGKGLGIWNTVETYLKKNGVEYEALLSRSQGQIKALMNDLCQAHLSDDLPINAIVLGGDGTLDEALQGVVDFKKVNIGYIPTGSSNDFARAMSIDSDTITTLRKILNCSEPHIMDIGKLEYITTSSVRSPICSASPSRVHYFSVSCGSGFDAAVCAAALSPSGTSSKSFLNKIGLGKLIYLKIAITEIFKGTLPDGKIILDSGETVSFSKLRFAVGMNTCYEGGGFKFAPDAVEDDGLLDVCLVSDMSVLNAFLVLPKSAKGKHTSSRKVKTFKTKGYELITDEPLWIHTDGEVFVKSSHIKVSCEPGLLRLLNA